MKHILLLSFALLLLALFFFYGTTSVDQDELDEIDATLVFPNAPESSIVASKIFQNRCEPCHGTTAQNHALSKSDIINTWSAQRIEDALYAYKDGARDHKGMGKMMHGQATSLSTAEIKSLALYISTLK